jgi:predicted amidohydrolase YtcJ
MELNAYQNLIGILRDTLGPDLILRNGNIICMDPGNTTAEAVAVKDKKIIALGNNKDMNPWLEKSESSI